MKSFCTDDLLLETEADTVFIYSFAVFRVFNNWFILFLVFEMNSTYVFCYSFA